MLECYHSLPVIFKCPVNYKFSLGISVRNVSVKLFSWVKFSTTFVALFVKVGFNVFAMTLCIYFVGKINTHHKGLNRDMKYTHHVDHHLILILVNLRIPYAQELQMKISNMRRVEFNLTKLYFKTIQCFHKENVVHWPSWVSE